MSIVPICFGVMIGCVVVGVPYELRLERRATDATLGSGQVYTCPKGASYSLASGRRPDGLPQTYVFREPGHVLAAKVSPAGVQLLEGTPETMTYEALVERYPSPCDYLERPPT